MRCVPALVLRASSSVAQARIQLDGGPDGVDVVLVREAERGVSYYVFKARAVRDRLAGTGHRRNRRAVPHCTRRHRSDRQTGLPHDLVSPWA